MKEIPVLYENEEIYIISKPAGVSVQGGQGISHPLDEEFAKIVGQKIFLVHRLDKDTTGLMVIAKNPASASKWTKLIGTKQVVKEYEALCLGKMKNKQGTINETLEQHGEVKTAVTKYFVESEIEIAAGEEKYTISRIKLILQTGRMHQIRIHLSKNGCPIIGDDQHGNFKLNKVFKKAFKIKNMQLYAKKLTIPMNGQNLEFEISVPDVFTSSVSD